MGTRHDPAEQLLDLLVYAPLGLLMEAREVVPRLAEKGRQRMGGQVTVARMIGELAVRQGQRKAETVVERLREQRGGDGSRRAEPPPPAGPPPPAPPTGRRAAPPAATPASAAAPATPDASGLAIPGYDTLAASQVVPRLEGLSGAELDAIRAYEESSRARKTILTRIEQLRGSA